MSERRPLADYLALDYPFSAIADPDGGYVIRFSDLPGCLTQVESIEEVGPVAEEIKTLWIETEYERGAEIPLPSYPEEFSGKFNVRLPRSLHGRLVRQAEAEGVSLNQLVVSLLSAGVATDEVRAELRALAEGQDALRAEVAALTGRDRARTAVSPRNAA